MGKTFSKIKKYFKLKRLKIAEQILIVLFIAVLAPMIISSIVINNINQQAMRAQLRESAVLIANIVSEEIDVFIMTASHELEQINMSLNFFPSIEGKNTYLKATTQHFSQYADLRILNTENELKNWQEKCTKKEQFVMFTKTKDKKFLTATFRINDLNNRIFNSLKDDVRQIYVLDKDNKLIASHNYTQEPYNHTMELLPKKLISNTAEIFGDIKNQPLVYFKKVPTNITIIVNTTEKVTKKTINDNRFKLLLAVFTASLSVFIVVAIYIYYLYINIRQLFKGIMAMSKGSYERRIRLLTNVFTPYEIVFLAFEFNKMAGQIHQSYLQLKKNNEELKQLNEFRSNLIDTVSHELRTPLTSIQGYTSRLLRQDIQIDEDTKQKSLKTIKRQSERLKRMIEDLLVIPDIERSRIKIKIEPVWICDSINNSMILIKNETNKDIISNVSENFPLILADKDRLEQVIVNLLENAVKYAEEGSSISIDGVFNSETASLYIKNDCEIIPQEKLETLFEKFTRIDDKTTRTTRGTGLGLFIVKGLVEAMNGSILLHSNETNGFCVELTFPLFKSVTLKP